MKKLLAVVLSAVLSLSMFVSPQAVQAETEPGYRAPTGTPLTGASAGEALSWVTEPAAGQTYALAAPADLVCLSGLVCGGNPLAGVKLVMTNDLDMTGVAFRGIGYSASHTFAGIFDGQGFAVRNLTLQSESGDAVFGLFGTVTDGAEIRNLILDAGCVFTNSHVADKGQGSLVGRILGSVTVENIESRAVMHDGNGTKGYTGGIVGRVERCDGTAVIRNCSYAGSFAGSGNKSRYGGILAGVINITGTVEISDCLNTADISSEWGETSGGIFGLTNGAPAAVKITGCVNRGKVEGKQTLGGIAAQGRNLRVETCRNAGAVNARHGDMAGGIGGQLQNTTVLRGCVNEGTVTASGNNAGGMIASSEGTTVLLQNCLNRGTVTGAQKLGGMIGLVNCSESTVLTGCINEGTVSGKALIGGLFGDNEWNTTGAITATGCLNFGALTGTDQSAAGTGWSSVGGIAGRLQADEMTLTGCVNYGTLTHDGGFLGSMLGYLQTANSARGVRMNDCVQKGTLTGSATAGLMLGNAEEAAEKLSLANCYDAAALAAHFTGYQIGTYRDGDADGNKIRLVGTVDSLDYARVGFRVTVRDENGNTVQEIDRWCEFVYRELLGEGENIRAEKYRAGGYLFALAVYGVPAGTYTFEVQTLARGTDGTMAASESAVFQCTVPLD